MTNFIKQGYLDLNGHPTWSTEWANNGEPALLMHGGLSATEDWDFEILPAIAANHHVFAYDRTAHGRTGIQPGFYHFDFQADEAIAYIETVIGQPAHLLGWSDGGIVSLLVALKRPDLVKSIVAIGTNFHWNSLLIMGDPDEELVINADGRAEFAERSPDPAPTQDEIVKKAFDVWRSEPTLTKSELAKISCPVLVLSGDDEPFSIHHSVDLYEALPDGRLAVIPAASHYVVHERNQLMVATIKDFFDNPGYPVTKYPRMRKR